MSATPYLKNASARKDADGKYWLFIQGGNLKAMFQLIPDDEARFYPAPCIGCVACRPG